MKRLADNNSVVPVFNEISDPFDTTEKRYSYIIIELKEDEACII